MYIVILKAAHGGLTLRMAPHIFRSKFPDVHIQDDISLPGFLLNSAAQFGDKVALVCCLFISYFTIHNTQR